MESDGCGIFAIVCCNVLTGICLDFMAIRASTYAREYLGDLLNSCFFCIQVIIARSLFVAVPEDMRMRTRTLWNDRL